MATMTTWQPQRVGDGPCYHDWHITVIPTRWGQKYECQDCKQIIKTDWDKQPVPTACGLRHEGKVGRR